MATYRMKERSIPLDDSWDVIVVGGGPAGCTAAAAAAAEGARTLLVEAKGALGGMSTSGLVPVWVTFSDQTQIIYRGLAEKVFTAAKAGMPHVGKSQWDWVPIDPELLKRVYDCLVTGAGATVLFNTVLSAVEVEKAGAVSTLILSNKSGLGACRAKVYVDCSGDADLAAWAGAEYEKGDGEGTLQPATLCFVLSNVDMYGYQYCGSILRSGDKEAIINKIVASRKYPHIVDFHADNQVIGPGTVGCNVGHMWKVDGTDPASVSGALAEGRRLAAEFRDAFAEFFPRAFANACVSATASMLGIRETRRIIGDYVLTLDDFKARRTFNDEIARNCYPVDIQNASADMEDIRKAQADYDNLRFGPGESYGIPYRCLTPRGLRNVLVAGRCISTDRPVQGSTRMLPVCLVVGQAAGTAAALAAAGDSDVHAVDTGVLRRRLVANGAYLPESRP
jgi:hypothetical protein